MARYMYFGIMIDESTDATITKAYAHLIIIRKNNVIHS